jgi:hypothetical protein
MFTSSNPHVHNIFITNALLRIYHIITSLVALKLVTWLLPFLFLGCMKIQDFPCIFLVQI